MNIGKYLEMYSEDLKLKNYALNTIENYKSQVGLFLKHFNNVATKPSEISEKQIKEWLLLAKSINGRKHRISAVKLFYKYTGKQPLKFRHIEYPKSERRLPQIIDKEFLLAQSFEKEIWKAIEKFENSYEISSYGRIKSLKRKRKNCYQSTSIVPENVNYGSKLKNGYLKTVLYKEKHRKQMLIHRLVAMAFIPKVKNKDCVNHKDGNKENNNYLNLEWCNHKENNNHALRKGLTKFKITPFKGINIKTNEEIFFDNTQDASDFVKGNRGNIHKCLKKQNNRVVAYGYIWEYI